MTRTLTIVEDGTATASALAAWLEHELGPGVRVAAIGPSDVDRVVAARAEVSERVLTLTDHGVEGAALDGSAALGVVAGWLADLDPFATRAFGADRIEQHVARGEAEAAPLLSLVRRARGAAPVSTTTRPRRGRPPGSRKHFVGVELDVSVAMLIEPERGWSERELAEVTGRSRFGVHRALESLAERGYLRRERGDTRPRDPRVLREDLARAWAAAAQSREARWYLAPRPRQVNEDAWSACERRGIRLMLAGASASDTLAAGPTIVYASDDAEGALGEASFIPSRAGRGQLAVWSPPTAMVFYRPRELEGREATNRVITFLDLLAAGTDRYEAAAHALWEEA